MSLNKLVRLLKKDESFLVQIRYYFGEESSHDVGFGVAFGNLSVQRDRIKEEYKNNKISGELYFIKGCLVQLITNKEEKDAPWFCGEWGKLGIKLIGKSTKTLEKCANFLKLPFNKRVLIPYVLPYL